MPNFSINELFNYDAVMKMRKEIADASENEVFFGGNLNEHGVIGYVEVIARGNAEAAPAIMHVALEYDAVIHNHPSGHLAPSNADIGVASELGNAAIGFLIVNNTVDDVYTVVAPFMQEERETLDIPEILFMFTENGVLPKVLPGFEYRHEQTVMVERVLEAVNEDKHLIIEAGTGVGKSLAYIVPTLLWLKANKGRIVISTNTINLQQQIVEKDLPAVVSALAPEIPFILVKGRGNFVCIRKVREHGKRSKGDEGDDLAFDFEDRHEAFVRNIADWMEQTVDGSVSDLSFRPENDLWELVQCEADTCKRTRCNYVNDCFYYKMKKRMAKARVLVVNHHILCADLSIHAQTKGTVGFLPRYEKIIIDEAHNFEESASKYFGTDGSRIAMVKSLNYLFVQRGKRAMGFATRMRRIIEKNEKRIKADERQDFINLIDKGFIPESINLREALDDCTKAFFRYCKEHVGKSDETSFRFRISETFSQSEHWKQQGSKIIGKLAIAFSKCLSFADKVKNAFLDLALEYELEYEDIIDGYQTYLTRLKQQHDALTAAIDFQQDKSIRWFELFVSRRGVFYLNWHLTPVEIGSYLNDALYHRFETVILTSATLTVNKEFSFFEERLGLTLIKPPRLIKEHLESPYDYEANARLYIAQDVGEPSARGFNDDVIRYLKKMLPITFGRAFILFTSFSSLRYVYNAIENDLRSMGLTPLMQGGSMQRNALLDAFRKGDASVLFGVQSFWEGVDVVGKDLEMIVIPKLPFAVPTDPISEARAEYVEIKGGNSFIDYSVPLAVIRFKQGFGRLIRSKADRGIVLLLDKRAVTKGYGVNFTNSLPPVRVMRGGITEITRDATAFFD